MKMSYQALKKLGREMLESTYLVGNEGLNMHDVSVFTRQNGPFSSRSAYALPSTERPQHTRSMRSDTCERQGPSPSHHSGWTKADFGNSIGFSRGRPRSGGAVNIHQAPRH